MPAITPQFLMDFESQMQAIVEDEYSRLSSHLWWSDVAKLRPSSSKREVIAWLLSTAQIEDIGVKGGELKFRDIEAKYTEYEPRFAGAGLRLLKSELQDHDGKGLELAGQWARDIGAYMAYWPQKKIAEMILAGEGTTLGTAYDGLAFFSKSHLLHPLIASGKTYANLFSGAAASTPSTDPNDAIYPGACPIDDSVNVETALTNLSKVYAYIASITMVNGSDPRYLRPAGILAPPRLMPRAVQLTGAKTLAQAATSGGGSADVEALIKFLGLGTPTEVDEFRSEPTSYYVVAEQLSSSQLGAMTWIDREPFAINYYSGVGGSGVTGIDAILNRSNELEWQCRGRNTGGYGHPFLLFKVKAT